MTKYQADATHTAVAPAFFIPAVDDAIPACLDQNRKRSRALACFADAGRRAGVPLPAGSFVSIEQVVRAQWNQLLVDRYPPGIFDGLAAGAPAVSVSDEKLEIVIEAQASLNAFQLKPVVEALEAAACGLGWFVVAVLTDASCHGHQIYDMAMASYMLEVFHGDLDEFSDQGYARALLLQQGEVAASLPESIGSETMAALRQEYGFWPSELLADVGGHAHLLRRWDIPAGGSPKVLGVGQASRWLEERADHALAGAVGVAIRLHRALRKDAKRAFVWNGADDETEPMGALCFLCWDDPQLLFEAVSHFEQNQYSAGMAVEAFARASLELAEADATALRALAADAVAYFDRWALLLAFFPGVGGRR